ncbi:kinase [Thraustotheca clavata]|uniref:Kinase n=1 Tax=Thraustotheca clavata TaxID=74557 RepID=A0A1W0A338_9STRA|nr:kinase [Thraustotheca clavata]
MDRYSILTILAPAQGGDILLCKHNKTRTPYVVKRIELLPTTKDNIAMEIQAYTLLHSFKPNMIGANHVLKMTDIFEEKERCHLVLEHCADGEFYKILKSLPGQHCDAASAKAYFAQIAEGVYYIHQHRLAHRDLSLENIFVSSDGTLKIGDFGLAVVVPSIATKAVGKLYYMAPEMYNCPQGYDPSKVDVWSLGILLWMLLTGLPLVNNSSADDETFAFIQQYGLRTLVQVWNLSHLVPEEALDILEKLLIADPTKRLSMTDALKHNDHKMRFSKSRTIATTAEGMILLAHDNASNRNYAIKQIRISRYTQNTISREVAAYQVLTNAAKFASHGSKHVLQCYGSVKTNKNHILMLEYCARGDLYNVLKAQQNHRCSPSMARNYIGQIARGLHYLHQNNLAHRDLSLENIFVQDNDILKIGDFGLTVQMPCSTTAAVGKPYYEAPEMHYGIEYDATKADVWSLGIIFWMLLTGVTLFESSLDTDVTFAYFKRWGIRALVQTWNVHDISPEALNLLEFLLVVDPCKRPSMEDVLAHKYFRHISLL